MSDRRRFLKGLTSIPLATVLANPRLAAAVSVGLQDVEAKLGDGGTISTGYSDPRLPSEFASEKANLPHFD